jgi:hypothetical protein
MMFSQSIRRRLATFRRQRSPYKERERVPSTAYSASLRYHESPLATNSSGALAQSIEKAVGHAFPRHYLDKAWKVEGLDGVYLAEDGFLRCVVRWERSVVAASDLAGEELLKRREELFKE